MSSSNGTSDTLDGGDDNDQHGISVDIADDTSDSDGADNMSAIGESDSSHSDLDDQDLDEDQDNSDYIDDNDALHNIEPPQQNVDEPPAPQDPGAPPLEPDRDITKAILRIIEAKVIYGSSQEETLRHLRNLYEVTGDESVPHASWHNVMKYLKELGYEHARCYKVCFGEDHVLLLKDNEDCPE